MKTMKTNLRHIAAFTLASMSLAACNDLDTKPMDQYVTSQEKQEAIASNPELASAGVVGISPTYTPYGAVYDDRHLDTGWPAVMMMLDCIGPDLVSFDIGYNWYSAAGDYEFGNNNNYINNLGWYHAYKIILAANDVLKNIDPETTDNKLKLYAAQGYANRAFIYFNLAQLFQQTYKGHESLPCVPIITDENAVEAGTNGAPRATVEEVYAQVLADINKAITYLEECGHSVNEIADSGVTRFVSLGTAYGIRARVNLVMNKWKEAAEDAANAIAKSGKTPYSIEEASRPAFNKADDHNLMWCVYVQENDRVVTTQICNWPSHMGTFNYGYAQVGSWRKISKSLFASIPASDCRRGWFLDSDGQSKNLNEAQAKYVASNECPPYTQVKFAPYKDVINTTTNATSVPLMRVEEMYLIQAEATVMGGDPATGKTLLENFVKTYRDPNYTCLATDAASLQEAVWMQRRVELWGEGMCYFDLLRLNKGLDRRGGGWESQWVYNVPAPLKPFLVPNGEEQTNKALGNNNEAWSKPTAVDDL